jgi:hypothetical protein
MISIKHNLLDVDFDNFTFKEIIKVKKDCLYISRKIKEYQIIPENGYTSKFANFKEVTDGAYGFMHNPYSNVMYNINNMQRRVNYIIKNLSEELILDYVEFNNKAQTFNSSMMLGNYISADIFIEDIKKFDKACELYNKAYNSKNTIGRKYLGFKKGFNKGNYYRTVPSNHAGRNTDEYHEITVHDDCLRSKSYGFDEYWSIWTSKNSYNKNGSDGFKDVCKLVWPDEFI